MKEKQVHCNFMTKIKIGGKTRWGCLLKGNILEDCDGKECIFQRIIQGETKGNKNEK